MKLTINVATIPRMVLSLVCSVHDSFLLRKSFKKPLLNPNPKAYIAEISKLYPKLSKVFSFEKNVKKKMDEPSVIHESVINDLLFMFLISWSKIRTERKVKQLYMTELLKNSTEL